jgi:CheY-like chemotaxis protein
MLDSGVAVDVVLSDVMMPGSMDGVEFAAVARERFPRLPLILTTGRADVLAGKPLPSGVGVLRKPHSRSGIAAAIRRALAEARVSCTRFPWTAICPTGNRYDEVQHGPDRSR